MCWKNRESTKVSEIASLLRNNPAALITGVVNLRSRVAGNEPINLARQKPASVCKQAEHHE